MEKQRQFKFFSIVALVVSIFAMTLGFAAFSATLNISSSATVIPNSSDFKIKMYGMVGSTAEDMFDINNYINETNSTIFARTIDSNAILFLDGVASIDNSSLSLDIDTVNLVNPNEVRVVAVRVFNDGNYDAYFDTSQLKNNYLPTCTPGEGTSEALVEAACKYIYLSVAFGSKETFIANRAWEDGEISGNDFYSIAQSDCFFQGNKVCKLSKGESVFLVAMVVYDDTGGLDAIPRADGPFSVTFPEIKLEFTSNDTSVE